MGNHSFVRFTIHNKILAPFVTFEPMNLRAPIRFFLPFLALLGLVAGSALNFFQAKQVRPGQGLVYQIAHGTNCLSLDFFVEETESEKSDESEAIGKTFPLFSLGFDSFFAFPNLSRVNLGEAQLLKNRQLSHTGLYKTLGVFRI